MNLIYRKLTSEISKLLKYYPVITITGPRQSGKTTLCQELFPDYAYINLEDISIREKIQLDTKLFLEDYSNGLIIDEAHHYPDLFSYIQVYTDAHPERKFILTGSSNFSLLQNITQSLAGRTAILTLLPLSLHELGNQIKEVSTDTLILNGCYPAVWAKEVPPGTLYQNYYTTYIERDIRQIINIKDISLFQKFIRLAAGRIGTECNNSALAGEVGTSAPTINNWFSTLAASYIAYMLPPYYENIGKRLTKTPKIYFYDTGLACYLLGIENEDQLKNHPLRGNLFENMVINEAMKNRFNQGKTANLYFYRDKSQKEVDLLHVKANDFHIYEIKSGQTFHADFMNGINYFKNIFKNRVTNSAVIYDGDTTTNHMINFRDFYLE
ncbi:MULTISPECIES: ATP-binding protein [Odoribacteraceae]|uniref:ATP-binding protein n=1 Tax=Odoribacteraceae TaxID=1853231 RepID=UPI000E47682E|nr:MULTISPECIES: ATP-binding protein [Odoribacteraceae]MCQ4874496.1 ATP-binding protein [Butyricimonas paravirosa]RHR74093.1 ATP-binding protein [Odoribacter sp. AF15-53]